MQESVIYQEWRQEIEEEVRQEIEEAVAQKERLEERRFLALKMLQENIPIETIARITEFSLSQVQQLQSQTDQSR